LFLDLFTYMEIRDKKPVGFDATNLLVWRLIHIEFHHLYQYSLID